MAIVVGDREAKKQFLNYALPINRRDLKTGGRLGIKHFKLRRPFSSFGIEESAKMGRVIQGAANGSESILQE